MSHKSKSKKHKKSKSKSVSVASASSVSISASASVSASGSVSSGSLSASNPSVGSGSGEEGVTGRVSRAEKSEPYPVFEEDWYLATFKGILTGKGQFGPTIKFIFNIKKGEDIEGKSVEGREVNWFGNNKLIEGSALWNLIVKLIGSELSVGDDPTDDIMARVGKKYEVFMETTKKKSKVGNYYQKVTKIRKVKKS